MKSLHHIHHPCISALSKLAMNPFFSFSNSFQAAARSSSVRFSSAFLYEIKLRHYLGYYVNIHICMNVVFNCNDLHFLVL